MKTIGKHVYQNSFSIKKSEFITIAKQIKSKGELDTFLKQYLIDDAHHNCYAYKIGVEQVIGGFDDDGEPSGTAGKPIFNVIEKMKLTNIVVLIIRHFGGIKLGAGPLTRAYATSASELLNTIPLFNLIKIKEVTFEFKIENTKVIDNYLRINNIDIITKQYLEKPTYSVLIKTPEILIHPTLSLKILKVNDIYIESAN